jgi:NNP family nitrate/nitrite transporter-like MFS transporter
MEITSPGRGVMSKAKGTVTAVNSGEIIIGDVVYELTAKPEGELYRDEGVLVWPTKRVWQQPIVKVGDEVEKKQLLARGITLIFFQANVWIFAFLAVLLGAIWGIGKAAVYKYIPEYFPEGVGVVGGMVGVLGGLGGFVCPIIFGYLLEWTGLWTSCWMFMLVISVISLVWMHSVVRKMMAARVPELAHSFDEPA